MLSNLSLRLKLLILFIVLALIPLGIAGRTMIIITRDELKSNANGELRRVAQQLAGDFDVIYRDSWVHPMQLIRNSLDKEDLGLTEKISLLYTAATDIADVVSIQLSVEGMPTPAIASNDVFMQRLREASINPADVLKDDPVKILSYPDSLDVQLGEMNYLPQLQTWLMTLVLPLRNSLSGRTAYLSAKVKLDRLEEYIANDQFRQSGNIYVINKEKQQVFNPEKKILDELPTANSAVEMLASEVYTAMAEPYTRADGVEMLGAFAISKEFNWAIITEKRAVDAYQAVSLMVRNFMQWVIIGLVIAISGAIIFSHSVTKPLLRLTNAARTLAETNDLSIQVLGAERKDEIGQLSSTFNLMVKQLNRYVDELTETTKAKERAESELKLAKEIQQSFLPDHFPELETIEFFGRCDPAREVGGDYFDYFRLSEHTFGFVIADVSGKGVPAALFMAVSRTLFRMLCAQGFNPQQVVREFNNRLVQLDQSSNLFITLFYGVYDIRDGSFTYSNAGHCLPMIIHQDKRTTILPEMKTMVAGIMEDIPLEEHAVSFTTGDLVVLYTDGMTEAINSEEEEYGEERLLQFLQSKAELDVKTLCLEAIEEVKQYQENMPQFDDMTFFAIKIKSLYDLGFSHYPA